MDRYLVSDDNNVGEIVHSEQLHGAGSDVGKY